MTIRVMLTKVSICTIRLTAKAAGVSCENPQIPTCVGMTVFASE